MLIVAGKMLTYSVLHRWVYTVYLVGNWTGYLLTGSDDSDSFACLIVTLYWLGILEIIKGVYTRMYQ